MHGQRGQASIEYTALLALVGVLFATVVLADLPAPEAPRWLADAMCAAWKGARCSEGAEDRPRVAARPAPPSVLQMRAAATRERMGVASRELRGEVASLDREIAGRLAAIVRGEQVGRNAARVLVARRRRARVAARARRFSGWAADPGRTFVDFDPRGDGRLVEVHGDLERAPHVAVMVPGMGSDIDGFEDLVPRARDLRVAARRFGKADVAVVTWLGYDPPDALPGAALGGRARTGGRSLSRFVNEIERTRDPHTTVIGHSYGSVTTGHAAARERMDADDVVFTGSPGTGDGRRDVSELGGRSRFWAGETRRDVVAWAPSHGEAPGDPSFGARTFDATGSERGWHRVVHNHQSYYDAGGASLAQHRAHRVGTGGRGHQAAAAAPATERSRFRGRR